MSKAPKKVTKQVLSRRASASPPPKADFDVVLGLIATARARAVAAVNTTLIDLYWSIGQYISRKTSGEGWGKGTVRVLAATI